MMTAFLYFGFPRFMSLAFFGGPFVIAFRWCFKRPSSNRFSDLAFGRLFGCLSMKSLLFRTFKFRFRYFTAFPVPVPLSGPLPHCRPSRFRLSMLSL
ncbi:hypothetical protein DFJ73DRAFT_805769, partial [Zopfochytrium polystomum]